MRFANKDLNQDSRAVFEMLDESQDAYSKATSADEFRRNDQL